jgi:hypothetical protein
VPSLKESSGAHSFSTMFQPWPTPLPLATKIRRKVKALKGEL